jgi:V-type H+-transporting ATPase subunit H
VELLRTSHEPVVLAVAAHDLGQYVKYYERGKRYVAQGHFYSSRLTISSFENRSRIVTDLGAKNRVMELMSHGSREVQYQALLSVQRLVSSPWQSV